MSDEVKTEDGGGGYGDGYDVSFGGAGGAKGAAAAGGSTAEQKAAGDYYNQYGGNGYGGGYPPGYGYGYGQGGAGYGGGGGYGGMGGGYGMGMMPPDATSPLDAEVQMVVTEMRGELQLFESAGEYGTQFKNAKRLLTTEVERLEQNIDPEWLEVDIPKPIKLTKKVLIPNFRHPHFNFVGKVLGPRGQTLQTMAKQFKCHIYVLGRGSTKDRNKEQELLNSGDPQYAHYGGPLHVKVETIAPAHIAYQRVAGVLEVLANTLIPVRDELVESQMALLNDGTAGDGTEGGENGGGEASGSGGAAAAGARGRGRGRGTFVPRGGPMMGGMRGRGGGPGGMMRGGGRGGGPMGGGGGMRGGGGIGRGGRGMAGPGGFFAKPGGRAAPY